jgi:2-amino-4-hydroxy-6-hydroxymethyldihydropteridine diphosphokinase
LARAFLGLGSNIGDRVEHLKKAIRLLRVLPMSSMEKISSIYETSPWGNPDQDAFLNQAIEIKTDMTPEELLEACQAIEYRLGRARAEKWGARTVDIDILLYDSILMDKTDLRIPHPQLTARRFVLVPLCEIAPDLTIPIANRTVSQMLQVCEDAGSVRSYNHNG